MPVLNRTDVEHSLVLNSIRLITCSMLKSVVAEAEREQSRYSSIAVVSLVPLLERVVR